MYEMESDHLLPKNDGSDIVHYSRPDIDEPKKFV